MMRAMEPGEQSPIVHGAVRPAEVGVVGHENRGERQNEVDRARLIEITMPANASRSLACVTPTKPCRENQRRSSVSLRS